MADDRKSRSENRPAPGGTDEPQSYGSGKDWLQGTTGQTVEGTPHRASRHDEAFYDQSLDAHRDSASEAHAAPDAAPRPAGSPSGATGATSLGGKKIAESNATRQSYFRKRDYD